jgi:hypothetical protein
VTKEMNMTDDNTIALSGLFIILICSMNFLYNPWSVIGITDFIVTCFGVSYLINLAQKNNKKKKEKNK